MNNSLLQQLVQLIHEFVSQSFDQQVFQQINNQLIKFQQHEDFLSMILQILMNKLIQSEDEQLIASIQLKNWLKENITINKPMVASNFNNILQILASSPNIGCFKQNAESYQFACIAIKCEDLIKLSETTLLQLANQTSPFLVLLKIVLLKHVSLRRRSSFQTHDKFADLFAQVVDNIIVYIFNHVAEFGDLKYHILQNTLDTLIYSFQPHGVPAHAQCLHLIVQFCIDGFNANLGKGIQYQILALFIQITLGYQKLKNSGLVKQALKNTVLAMEQQLPIIVQFVLHQYKILTDYIMLAQCTKLLRQIINNDYLFQSIQPILQEIITYINELLGKLFSEKCTEDQLQYHSSSFWEKYPTPQSIMIQSQQFYPNLYCLLTAHYSLQENVSSDVNIQTLDEEIAQFLKLYYQKLPRNQTLLMLQSTSVQIIQYYDILNSPSTFFVTILHLTAQMMTLNNIEEAFDIYDQLVRNINKILQSFCSLPPYFVSLSLWSFDCISISQVIFTVTIELLNQTCLLLPGVRTIQELFVCINFCRNKLDLVNTYLRDNQRTQILQHLQVELFDIFLMMIARVPQEFQFYKDIFDTTKLIAEVFTHISPVLVSQKFCHFFSQQIELQLNGNQMFDLLSIFSNIFMVKQAECEETTYNGMLQVSLQLLQTLIPSFKAQQTSELNTIIAAISNLLTSFSSFDYFSQNSQKYLIMFQLLFQFVVQQGDSFATHVTPVLINICDCSRILNIGLSQQIIQFLLSFDFNHTVSELSDLQIISRGCLGICLNFQLSTEQANQILNWSFSHRCNLDQSDTDFDYMLQLTYYLILNVQIWTIDFVLNEELFSVLFQFLPIHCERLKSMVDIRLLIIYFMENFLKYSSSFQNNEKVQSCAQHIKTSLEILELGLQGQNIQHLVSDKNEFLYMFPQYLVDSNFLFTIEPQNLLHQGLDDDNERNSYGFFMSDTLSKIRLFSCMWPAEIEQARNSQKK